MSENIGVLLGSFGGFLVVLGGGVKYLLHYLDAKDVVAELRESQARSELSNRLHDEINDLRKEVSKMRDKELIYLRRIYQLEIFIHQQPNLKIPTLEGWPLA